MEQSWDTKMQDTGKVVSLEERTYVRVCIHRRGTEGQSDCCVFSKGYKMEAEGLKHKER